MNTNFNSYNHKLAQQITKMLKNAGYLSTSKPIFPLVGRIQEVIEDFDCWSPPVPQSSFDSFVEKADFDQG